MGAVTNVDFVIRARQETQRALDNVTRSVERTNKVAVQTSRDVQREAQNALQLFGNLVGVQIPRQMENFLAKLPGMARVAGAAMAGAIGGAIVVGVMNALNEIDLMWRRYSEGLARGDTLFQAYIGSQAAGRAEAEAAQQRTAVARLGVAEQIRQRAASAGIRAQFTSPARTAHALALGELQNQIQQLGGRQAFAGGRNQALWNQLVQLRADLDRELAQGLAQEGQAAQSQRESRIRQARDLIFRTRLEAAREVGKRILPAADLGGPADISRRGLDLFTPLGLEAFKPGAALAEIKVDVVTPALHRLEQLRNAFLEIRESTKRSAEALFDAMVTRGRTGILDFVKALGLTQVRAVFANVAGEILTGLGSRLGGLIGGQFELDPATGRPRIDKATGQPVRTRLGRILEGTVFGATNLRALNEAAAAHIGAAGALTAAADALESAAGALNLAAVGGARGGAPLGSPFVLPAFGSDIAAFFRNNLGLIAGLGASRLIGGKGGATIGAAVAGGLFGMKAAGFGLAGLGKLGGFLLGAGIAGGLVALGLYGIPALFGGGLSPEERQKQIEGILSKNQFTLPEALNKQFGISGGMTGELDFAFGNVPRMGQVIVVQVERQESDSTTANRVRRALQMGHPLQFAVKEFAL